MDHNKRVWQCTLVIAVLIYVYPSVVKAQDNGMNIVGEKDEDKNKTGGIENNNASFLIKREQHIPDNASKSQDLQTDKIGETVLTVLPSVLGVLMTGIIFSILMLIFLVKKQRNKILLPENANLL